MVVGMLAGRFGSGNRCAGSACLAGVVPRWWELMDPLVRYAEDRGRPQLHVGHGRRRPVRLTSARRKNPKPTPKPPEAMSLERAVEQRMRRIHDPHRARENPAKMLQYVPFSEKLWKAAHALFPEGSLEAAAFARERAARILSSG